MSALSLPPAYVTPLPHANGERCRSSAPAPLRPLSAASPEYRLLVIDDTPAIHEDFRKILSEDEIPALAQMEAALFGPRPDSKPRTRFCIDSAFQGQEGLARVQDALAEGRPYSLAFVDIRMPPGWDGIETIAHLWAADPELQVVICTAYADYSWGEMTQRLGDSDSLVILKKPFDNIEVLQLAHALARKWSLALQAKGHLSELNRAIAQRTADLSASNAKQLLQSAALESAANSIVITDSQGTILWSNPAFTRLTGYTSEEVLGKKPSMLKSGKQDPATYSDLWQTIAAGRVWQGEMVNRRKDGSLYNEEMTITPVRDEHGVVTHYIAVKQDITQRTQSEMRVAAFATLGERLSAATTSKEAAQIIVEVGDKLLGWDACMCNLYSQEKNLVEHVLRMDVIDGQRTECFPERSQEPPTPLVQRAISGNGFLLLRDNPQEAHSPSIRFGDTSRPSASILFVPIRNGQRVAGVLSIQSYAPKAYDQSSLQTLQALADHCGSALDRIKSEAALRTTQQELRQVQKMEAIGQLAGGVAHDFNNLLVVMRGNAELLLLEPALQCKQSLECLQQITAAAERAANLTRQLLAFSRKQVMQSQPLVLNDVVANLTKMLKRIIGENIDLQCRYAAGLPFVQADTGMLEQVLVNLVVNARDAMPQGGQLHLATEKVIFSEQDVETNPEARPGNFVCLSVHDTGTGIAPGNLPRIFEPFFTTKPLGKGTGLGLATVYGIVKQHQGWIEVASQPAVGTTFKIFLPAIPAPAVAPDSGPEESKPRGGSETILLVEDDEPVRFMTRRLLVHMGYTVLQASRPSEALQIWAEHAQEISLLLSDILMPEETTGRDLAENLQTQKPSLKVILMSGYSPDAAGKDTDFFRRTGCYFIQKPCPSSKLLETIRNCLDEKKAKG